MSPPLPEDRPAVASGPHALSERIDVLDVIRGIALFGMYVVHFHDYAAEAAGDSPTAFMTGIDHLTGLFFDGRFYTMFGILFGVGFAASRADSSLSGPRGGLRSREHPVTRWLSGGTP